MSKQNANEEVAEVVTKVRHSNTCRRNGHCRFRYPHPPSPRTVIARQVPPDDSSEETKAAMAAVVAVRNVLDDKNTPEDISLEQLLDRAKVPHDTYVRGLGICTKGNSIVYHRERSDAWINPYNADVMRVWRANMHGPAVHLGPVRLRHVHHFLHAEERKSHERTSQTSV